jgi:hypothetical protein
LSELRPTAFREQEHGQDIERQAEFIGSALRITIVFDPLLRRGGERDAQRLTVGGLAHLKPIKRDHSIKSAH